MEGRCKLTREGILNLKENASMQMNSLRISFEVNRHNAHFLMKDVDYVVEKLVCQLYVVFFKSILELNS